MLKKLLLATLLLSSTTYAMHEFELNLNEKDIDVHLGLDMGQFNDNIEPDSFIIKARIMKGDREHARLPNEKNSNIQQDTNILGEFGFLGQSSSAMAPGLMVGMGMKLIYTPLENQSIFALPMGAVMDYTLPFDIIIPLHVGGQFYYAPEVLSFEKSTSYMEYQVNFDVELMERGLVTMGYRGIDTPTEAKTNAYYNRSFFIGFKFKF